MRRLPCAKEGGLCGPVLGLSFAARRRGLRIGLNRCVRESSGPGSPRKGALVLSLSFACTHPPRIPRNVGRRTSV